MSLTEKVYKVSELDANRFVFGEPKQNQKTRLVQLSLTYNDPNDGPVKPFIQSPIVTAPFGIQVDEFDGNKKTSMSISYKGYNDDKNPKMIAFYNLMNTLNTNVFEYAHKNSQQLFKKKCSKEILENNYTSLIKWSKDKETGERSTKYAPNTKLNFRKKYESEEYEVDVFDESKQKIKSGDIESVLSRKGLSMVCLIDLTSMWISGGGKGFGLSLAAKNIRLARQNRLADYAIRSDSDLDDEDDDDEITTSDVKQETNNSGDDSNEDESESEEDEINDAMNKAVLKD